MKRNQIRIFKSRSGKSRLRTKTLEAGLEAISKIGGAFRVQTLVCEPTPAKRGVGGTLKREL
jgi:hypothetical protein